MSRHTELNRVRAEVQKTRDAFSVLKPYDEYQTEGYPFDFAAFRLYLLRILKAVNLSVSELCARRSDGALWESLRGALREECRAVCLFAGAEVDGFVDALTVRSADRIDEIGDFAVRHPQLTDTVLEVLEERFDTVAENLDQSLSGISAPAYSAAVREYCATGDIPYWQIKGLRPYDELERMRLDLQSRKRAAEEAGAGEDAVLSADEQRLAFCERVKTTSETNAEKLEMLLGGLTARDGDAYERRLGEIVASVIYLSDPAGSVFDLSDLPGKDSQSAVRVLGYLTELMARTETLSPIAQELTAPLDAWRVRGLAKEWKSNIPVFTENDLKPVARRTEDAPPSDLPTEEELSRILKDLENERAGRPVTERSDQTAVPSDSPAEEAENQEISDEIATVDAKNEVPDTPDEPESAADTAPDSVGSESVPLPEADESAALPEAPVPEAKPEQPVEPAPEPEKEPLEKPAEKCEEKPAEKPAPEPIRDPKRNDKVLNFLYQIASYVKAAERGEYLAPENQNESGRRYLLQCANDGGLKANVEARLLAKIPGLYDRLTAVHEKRTSSFRLIHPLRYSEEKRLLRDVKTVFGEILFPDSEK